MTHTLESLKKILDEGGTIVDATGNRIQYENKVYVHYRYGHKGPWYPYLDDMIRNPSEWSEVKAEPTTITVPIDQWNALNKELGELRTKSISSKKPSWFPKDEGDLEIFCANYASWWDNKRMSSIQPDGWDWFEEFVKTKHDTNQTLDPAAEYGASFDEPLPAPARNTEEIKKGWDEFSIAMYRKAVEDSTKPYTFLPLPAAEIMVGIKSGQTWSNGYYTSSGCNEIGIYFDHKFGTTSVPWELVAGFIEENKIWEKK